MKPLKTNSGKQKNIQIEFLQESHADYDELISWKNSYSGNQFYNWINDNYLQFEEEGIQIDENIFFFNNESTFAFRISTEVLDINPFHLWNFWKDKVIEYGYCLKNSERVYKEKNNILRYYLKPRLKYKVEGEQLFGNITLELIKNQGAPKYILMKCTWYMDKKFGKAENYKNLMRILFS